MDERSIFLAALDRADPAERGRFLDAACGEDRELRRRVEALLKAHDDPDSFLGRPREDVRATVDGAAAAGPADDVLELLRPCDRPDRLGMLGTYEVIEVVGRGGMGVVFRALDPK